MSVRVTRVEGNFNYADPEQRQASWVIYLPDDAPARTINVAVPIGSEYDLEGEEDPFEVATILEGYIDKLLFSTSRKSQKEAIQWMRDHEKRIRLEFWNTKISNSLNMIGHLQKDIKDYHNNIMEILDEMADEGIDV